MDFSLAYKPGDIVYVIIKDPPVEGVAGIQEAIIVKDPNRDGELALFIYESYYPLAEETAVYQSTEEAEQAYRSVAKETGGEDCSSGKSGVVPE